MPTLTPFSKLVERKLRRLLGPDYPSLDPAQRLDSVKLGIEFSKMLEKTKEPDWGANFRDDPDGGPDGGDDGNVESWRKR